MTANAVDKIERGLQDMALTLASEIYTSCYICSIPSASDKTELSLWWATKRRNKTEEMAILLSNSTLGPGWEERLRGQFNLSNEPINTVI